MKIIGILAIGILMSKCATPQQQLEAALSLDVDHFKQTMDIADDQLEPDVVLSTADGYVQKHGLLGIVWSDSFLRGTISKATGEKSYLVYVALRHAEGDWARPYQANYGRPLRTVDVQDVASDVNCSASDLYGSCVYEEHVVFEIHPDEIARIGDGVTAEDLNSKVWQFRVKNQGTQDYNDAIFLAELIAMIDTMESYEFIPTQ